MIVFLVEAGGHRVPFDELEGLEARQTLDPLRSDLAARIAPVLEKGEALTVAFTISGEGEIGVEFRGEVAVLERLDAVLGDMQLSPPEAD